MYVSSLINNTKSKVYKKDYCKTHRIPQLFAIHVRNHLCCPGNKYISDFSLYISNF